ncbi:MAG TPA: hypothetical protein VGL72_25740 [Bryobacteraceae bacterium]|jgi:hypothetical protein
MARNAWDHGKVPNKSEYSCNYRFTVECSDSFTSRGQGSGGPYFGNAVPLAGPEPTFEMADGWLNLYPTGGWTRALPLFCFSGFEEQAAAMNPPYEMRNLQSYGIHIGEALQRVMQVGDTLHLTCNQAGDFSYRLKRNGEEIFRAGAVSQRDEGGPASIWQEINRELRPMPDKWPVVARINGQVFRLSDGGDAHVPPYYVFLARSTLNFSGIGLIPDQAVCASGKLRGLTRDLIRDAAQRLTPRRYTRIL